MQRLQTGIHICNIDIPFVTRRAPSWLTKLITSTLERIMSIIQIKSVMIVNK